MRATLALLIATHSAAAAAAPAPPAEQPVSPDSKPCGPNPGGQMVTRDDKSKYPYFGMPCTKPSGPDPACGDCFLDQTCVCSCALPPHPDLSQRSHHRATTLPAADWRRPWPLVALPAQEQMLRSACGSAWLRLPTQRHRSHRRGLRRQGRRQGQDAGGAGKALRRRPRGRRGWHRRRLPGFQLQRLPEEVRQALVRRQTGSDAAERSSGVLRQRRHPERSAVPKGQRSELPPRHPLPCARAAPSAASSHTV